MGIVFCLLKLFATIVLVQSASFDSEVSCIAQLLHKIYSRNACHLSSKINDETCILGKWDTTESKLKFGNVQLYAYTSEEYRQTVFRIIFSDITWTVLDFRIYQNHQKIWRNVCSTYTIWENITIPADSSLIYDRPWSTAEYEGKDHTLEYRASKAKFNYGKKYVFSVPMFERIDSKTLIQNLELFCYIDVTDPAYLTLHIQAANSSYKVTHYKIEVWREHKLKDTSVTTRFISADSAVNGELLFEHTTRGEGFYYFMVSFVSEECEEDECFKTVTAKHYIKGKRNTMVIGIVGASVVIPVLLFVLIMLKRKLEIKDLPPKRSIIWHPQECLIIYSASTKSHQKLVLAFTNFLQAALQLDILMDLKGIPNTSEKNPFIWCAQAFAMASYIIYIPSPQTLDKASSVYSTEKILLRYFRENLEANGLGNRKVYVMSLPYSAKQIPPDLTHFTTFDLNLELYEFVQDVVKRHPRLVLQSNLDRKIQKGQAYADLVDAVREAINAENEAVAAAPNVDMPLIRITNDVDCDSIEEAADEANRALIPDVRGSDAKFSFDINSLNLSGITASEEQLKENEGRVHAGFFDIQKLSL